jgi:hypothetical protein
MSAGIKITPQSIVARHDIYPQSTPKMIESYAFQEYRKCISDLMAFGRIVEVADSDTVMIVMTKNNFDNWNNLYDSHWYLNNAHDLP